MTRGVCGECRYWSELAARVPAGAILVEALCLVAAGPKAGSYVRGLDGCEQWAGGAPIDAGLVEPRK